MGVIWGHLANRICIHLFVWNPMYPFFVEILKVVYVSVERTVVIHSQEHVVSTYCCSSCTRNAAVCERAWFKRNEALTKSRNSQRNNCDSHCSLYTKIKKNLRNEKMYPELFSGEAFVRTDGYVRCASRYAPADVSSMGECIRSPTNTLCRTVTLTVRLKTMLMSFKMVFLRFALKLCPRTTTIFIFAVLKLDFSHLTFHFTLHSFQLFSTWLSQPRLSDTPSVFNWIEHNWCGQFGMLELPFYWT